jgi:hypothetical protein
MERRIHISEQYPSYWEFEGRPVLLLGGSVEDNLFQIPDIEEHLELLHSVGGNYVRCTMSSRDEGNVWPYEKREDGLYDLERPSREFWCRFSRFLALAYSMDIVVQIEVWATFDFYRDNWAINPFNPANNVNYDVARSGLPTEVDSHPVRHENPFFYSVPGALDNGLVLGYQRGLVDSLLAHSLTHPNVLYCMDNETNVTPHWGAYWSGYIQAQAAAQGLLVNTTEMWDAHDLAHETHKATFDHPETYSFVDISQNNHQVGQAHWDNMQRARAYLFERRVRPINNVKIYGADTGPYGTERDGLERFWRNMFGGMASARFHRPPAGLGLSETAQAHIQSARMLDGAVNVFACEPHNDLLSQREENEAYCMACLAPASPTGQEAALFFTRPGSVVLDTSAMRGDRVVRWLDIARRTWLDAQRVAPGDRLFLETPGEGMQAVVVKIGY